MRSLRIREIKMSDSATDFEPNWHGVGEKLRATGLRSTRKRMALG
jgi:hypothetical protein